LKVRQDGHKIIIELPLLYFEGFGSFFGRAASALSLNSSK